NIQSWLYHAESGDYETAWRTLTADNPLPAVMGRVCYHPCENACNRAQLHEAGPLAGGMMRFGIPKYRLPRDVLDAEIKRIIDLGVVVKLNSKIDRIVESMRTGRFDAAFLAVGAHIGRRSYIPAGSAAKILDAVSLLRSMEGEEKPLLGRRVVVYGGGNTALDAARTAKRLGANESIVVYRRTRERMPAHDFEVEE